MAAHGGTQAEITAKVRGQGAHLELEWCRFFVFSGTLALSRHVLFAVCYQKGFKCFRRRFSQIPGPANIGKCSQTTIGSFKNRVCRNDTKMLHGVSRELQKLQIWTHFRVSWASDSTKTHKNERSEKKYFWGPCKMLCRRLRVLPSDHEMSGHAGPIEPFGKEK